MKNSKVAVTAAMIQSVEIVLNDISKHRYSTTGIYNAHNAVFGLNEVPEACTSCLVNRAIKLKKWYLDYALEQAQNGKDVYGKKISEAAPTVPASNVPRETFTDLASIYENYLETEAPEDEAAAIAEITKQDAEATANGQTMLFDNERTLLQDRLAELSAPKVDVGTENFDVTDKDGNVHTVSFADEKLTFINADGEVKNMKAGTYSLVNGDSYAVQPGGKATFKVNESIL